MEPGLGLDLHAAEQGSSCSIRPALPLHVGKKESCQCCNCTVLYTSTVAHPLSLAGRWGPSPVQHQRQSLLPSQYSSAPVVGPSQKSQPWSHRNSICTYGGTTDPCYIAGAVHAPSAPRPDLPRVS